MIFWIKKIIAPFFQPLTISVLLLVIGCFLLWFRSKKERCDEIVSTSDDELPTDSKKEKAGTIRIHRRIRLILTLGTVWLVVISFSPFGGCMVQSLEYQYPALTSPAEHPIAKDATVIVVLGGGHSHGGNLPPTSELNLVTLARVVEAVRLHHALPESRIIFSGGAVYQTRPNAEVMAEAAMALGVSADAISTSVDSRDTKDEAKAIAQELGASPFILVTSASHMPRSVALFRKQGLNPIPAPAGQRTRPNDGTKHPVSVHRFFPSTGRIMALERAVHEYLGTAWGKLRKQL